MNEDGDYFQEERKRYPGSAGDADLRVEEALRLGQLAVNLFEHTLAVVRESLKLAQQSLDISKEAFRLAKQCSEKGNAIK
jgi:hypothetical protein